MTINYLNAYFSFKDHIFMSVIDCKATILNQTKQQYESEENSHLGFYDQCKKFMLSRRPNPID